MGAPEPIVPAALFLRFLCLLMRVAMMTIPATNNIIMTTGTATSTPIEGPLLLPSKALGTDVPKENPVVDVRGLKGKKGIVRDIIYNSVKGCSRSTLNF